MTREEAVDIIARKHIALTVMSTTGLLPERTFAGPDRKEIQRRAGEVAAGLNPDTSDYELAYDVLAHGEAS